jgi:hypothetical protein
MRKKIGVIGVDSGQVVICDPCYIDSEWDHKDEYKRDQVFDVDWLGKVVVVDMANMIKRGKGFNSPMVRFYGDTMNTLISKGLAKERPVTETRVFGYNGCCLATHSKDRGGQLNYKMGHAGAGVAVSTGYGDGVYAVYADYDEEGRVKFVTIDFSEAPDD